MIEVENLSASFGGQDVLQNVTFTANANEITVILGRSGCGKTTVMKHLIGLYPVRLGTVTILGKSFQEMDEEELVEFTLNMGVLFQNGALLNSLTVAENVAIPLQHHTSLPTVLIENLIKVKLKLMGLSHAYYLYPSQLSGGMRKRAALARALALDPPLLFCDEPAAGLDPVTLFALDQLILKLKQQLGMTILIITHEASSIFRIADRVVFMDKGIVITEGTLEEMINSNIPLVKEYFKKARGVHRSDEYGIN